MTNKRVSVVLSFRNEETNLLELIQRLQKTFSDKNINDYELVFVDDRSTDKSLEILIDKNKQDPRIKIIRMSRTFGVCECILAGFQNSSGEAVIYMDSDLQDPPELIPDLISEWEKGADIVHTVRKSRVGESKVKILLTQIAYRIIHFSSKPAIPIEAGDFKLLSRKAAKELLSWNDKSPYLRGMVNWLGFKQTFVHYDREPRQSGKSHFPLFQRPVKNLITFQGPIGTFAKALVSFSQYPLILIFYTGFVISFISLFCLPFTPILAKAFSTSETHTFMFLILSVIFGITNISLGTIGIYVAKLNLQLQNRPLFIIDQRIGFEPKPE